MKDFGKGATLKDASSELQDDRTRIGRILAVAEINSVIEGLPPFEEETRNRIRARITSRSAPVPTRPQ